MNKFALLLLAALVAFAVYAQPSTPQAYLPTVEGTLVALEDGITNLPLNIALANIKGWQTTLGAFDNPALQELDGLLGDLAVELQAETINPAEVGNLLVSLGEGTSAAAGGAGDEQLAELGTLLAQAGDSLMNSGMSGGMTGGMSDGGM